MVRVYSALVYYWCRSDAGLSPEDSDDVLQSVFAAVAKGIGEFQKENGQGSFRGWLRVITTNKIHDHRRRESRQPRATGGSDAQSRLGQVPDASPQPDNSLSQESALCEQSILINRVLDELRPHFDDSSWQAFWQAEIRERPRQDVADELQMSVAAVNQAIYRIRKRLREELNELIE